MKSNLVCKILCIGFSASLLLPLSACGEEDSSRGRYEEEKKDDTDPVADTKPTEQPPIEAADPPASVQTPETVDSDLYSELSDWSFVFSSGAGGWGTEMYFSPDGSFMGDYHDSEMGDTGPGYSYGSVYTCSFSGKCDGFTEEAPGIYRLHIAELNYDPVGVETIDDEIRYITAAPYGLEGTDELIVYLPGVPLEDLAEGYMDWIGHGHFSQYVGPDFDWYEDYPEELPFCGLYNPADEGYGFYSLPDCRENKMCLKNMAKLPSLINQELTINEDGTYYCEDMDPYGNILIKNAAVRIDSTFPDAFDDLEGCIRKCIESIPGQSSPKDLYVPNDDYRDFSLTYISGEPVYYAFWEEGGNEDTRWCSGIFHLERRFDADGNTTNGYALIYMFSVNADSEQVDTEFMDNYLHSLAYSGSFEGLSSESTDTADHWITAYVQGGNGSDGILADEVVWISGDDTETLARYNIDPDDVANDYAIGGADGNYESFDLSPDCPIYQRFPENIFERYMTYDALCNDLKNSGSDRLMMLLLDKNGTVVAMYEPYTP